MDPFAKVLMALGVGLVVLGGAIALGGKLGLGRLPGDFRWQGDGVQVYVPLATCLLVSVVATLVLNLFLRR